MSRESSRESCLPEISLALHCVSGNDREPCFVLNQFASVGDNARALSDAAAKFPEQEIRQVWAFDPAPSAEVSPLPPQSPDESNEVP
jgi:hypothetical protein